MLVENLIKLDFTKSEAKILIFLLHNNKSTASKVSKETQINRTTTYDILNRLMEKGLISYVIKSNIKYFMTKNLDLLEKQYKEKYEWAKELTIKLNNLKQENEELTEIYEGIKGIRSILKDILNHSEYVAFGSSGKILEVMKHDFLQFQKEKKKRKIKSRILQNKINKDLQQIAYAQIKFFQKSEESPVTTIIYGNKVAILTWGLTPNAILIESEIISKQFKHHFEHLWKMAKK
ncbi:MAG: TrmB family transcriptional regulator [Candidatus Woesearchaeota archaeon]